MKAIVMFEQTTSVAEAFSRKSLIYDDFGLEHPNLSRMRQRVYAAVDRYLHPQSHLLEINAGTGLDATQIVKLGHTVHATDLSEGMVAAIEQKIDLLELRASLSTEILSFTHLDQVKHAPFDAVYSNFGGLNCVEDLTQVTRHLPQILRPGGLAIWTIMPPICPWEIALLLKDWRVATRRLHKDGVVAHVEGVPFKTWYFTPKRVMKAFGPAFECVALEGLSVVTPTADNKSFAQKRATLFQGLVTLDEAISHHWPFNRMGDFFIITMRFISK